jgi:hypothetical protein
MTKTKHIATQLFFLSAFLLASGGVHAAKKDDAKEAVRRGVDLLAKKDYQGALAAFREAREIEPSPMTTAQIAFVHIGMARWLEAESDLQEALAESSDTWVAQHQDQLRSSLNTVQQHIGSLRVQGTPEGAEVRFRGEVVGLLPMRRPIPVITGSGMVKVQMAGFEPTERAAQIEPRLRTDLSVNLQSTDSKVPSAAAESSRASSPAPTGIQMNPEPVPAAGAAASDANQGMKTLRWAGLLGGGVLVGASVPFLIWQKHSTAGKQVTAGDTALTIIGSGACAVGIGGIIFGVESWIFLSTQGSDSSGHASLKSSTLTVGGIF